MSFHRDERPFSQVVLALLLLSNTGDLLVYTHDSLSVLAGPDTARFAL